MIFLNSASSAAALVFYLPGVCTHTDTKGKQRKEYFKIFGKNTIFNEHPVCYVCKFQTVVVQMRHCYNIDFYLSSFRRHCFVSHLFNLVKAFSSRIALRCHSPVLRKVGEDFGCRDAIEGFI